MTVRYVLVMDLDAVTTADIAHDVACGLDWDFDKNPTIKGWPAKLTSLDTYMPSGDAQVTIRLTDREGVTRTFTARVTVQETC